MIRRRPVALVSDAQRLAAATAKRTRDEHLFALYAGGLDGRVRLPETTVTDAVLTLRLPHRLLSPNEWLWTHWRVKKRAKDAWAFRVELALSCAGQMRTVTCGNPSIAPIRFAVPVSDVELGWLAPTNRPTVTITRQVPSRRNFITDRENRYFAAKALVDCLVQAKLLTNDRESDIDLVVDQAVSTDGQDWTQVVIDARPVEARGEAPR